MNILIVEDERIAARRLARLTQDILGDAITELTCRETLEESEEFLQGNRIDLLLLDLNLHGKDGFGLLSRVTAGPFQTIVVSANTDQAIRAFEYGVLDFVPKPFDRDRLEIALRRFTKQVPEQNREHATKYLSIRRHGSLSLVDVEDVAFFKGAGDYVEIQLKDGASELHSKSLDALEKILPSHFRRVHKSYLVDMRQVSRILVHGGGKYELELADNTHVPLSRTRYRTISQLTGM